MNNVFTSFLPHNLSLQLLELSRLYQIYYFLKVLWLHTHIHIHIYMHTFIYIGIYMGVHVIYLCVCLHMHIHMHILITLLGDTDVYTFRVDP